MKNINKSNIMGLIGMDVINIKNEEVGFTGNEDLEKAHQVAKYQVEHPYTVAHKFRYPGEDADEPYSAYVDQIIANLTSMKNSVDSKEIDALISDIFRYEKVSAFGYLQSENVALNLQYDLQTSRKIIFTCMQIC